MNKYKLAILMAMTLGMFGCASQYDPKTYDPYLLKIRNSATPSPRWAETKSGCRIWDDKLLEKHWVSWTGSCVNGKAHGFGVAEISNVYGGWISMMKDSKYEGDYVDGKRHGQGKIEWLHQPLMNPDGTVEKWHSNYYEGEWADGLMHGKGLSTIMNLPEWKTIRGIYEHGRLARELDMYSPLQFAIMKKDVSTVRALLASKANITAESFISKDTMTIAFESNIYDVEAVRKMDYDFCKTFIPGVFEWMDVKTTPNSILIARSTAIPLTAAQKEIIELLLLSGLRMPAESVKTNEFIEYVLQSGNTSLLKTVVSAGVNVNAKVRGRPLLELAVTSKNLKSAEFLVEKGAEQDFRPSQAENIVFLALQNGEPQIARMLVKRGAKIPDLFDVAERAAKNWEFDEFNQAVERANLLDVISIAQKKALQDLAGREKQRQVVARNEQARQASLARTSAGTSGGSSYSGSTSTDNAYTCTFRCRANGINGWQEAPMTVRVRSTNPISAESAATREAEGTCRNYRGKNGDAMFPSGMSCN